MGEPKIYAGNPNSNAGRSVRRVDKKYICSKLKAYSFTWFENLLTSTGLCPYAKISTDLIQGLQLVSVVQDSLSAHDPS